MLSWQRKLIYWTVSLLMVSGLIWLAAHWAMPSEQQLATDTAQINAKLAMCMQLKYWSIRVHTFVALVVLIVIGSLIPAHILARWPLKRNIWSGVVNIAAFIVLTLTGYMLWYVSEGGIKQWATWLHWVIGMALPIVLAVHIKLGKT